MGTLSSSLFFKKGYSRSNNFGNFWDKLRFFFLKRLNMSISVFVGEPVITNWNSTKSIRADLCINVPGRQRIPLGCTRLNGHTG